MPLDDKGSQLIRRHNDTIEKNVVKRIRKKAKIIETTVREKHDRLGRHCNAYGCKRRSSDENTYLKSVPARPAPLNIHSKDLRNYDRIQYCCHLDYRRRIPINLGLHPNDTRKDIRLCTHQNVATKKLK